MPSDIVSAADDDLRLPIDFHQCGSRVRIRRFARGIGWPLLAPENLAAVAVEGNQIGRIVGLIAVQDLDNDLAVEQERRAAIAPIEAKGTVFLLEIFFPDFLAVK